MAILLKNSRKAISISALASLTAALSLAFTPLSSLAQAKPLELRYTSGAPPKGNPWAMQVERFAKDVSEESKGGMVIQPFFASQLGSEQDTVQQVARGRIDWEATQLALRRLSCQRLRCY